MFSQHTDQSPCPPIRPAHRRDPAVHRHGLLVEALGVGRGRGVAGGAGRGLGGAWALPGGGLGGLGAVDGGSGGQGRRQVEQVWVGGGRSRPQRPGLPSASLISQGYICVPWHRFDVHCRFGLMFWCSVCFWGLPFIFFEGSTGSHHWSGHGGGPPVKWVLENGTSGIAAQWPLAGPHACVVSQVH